MTKTTGRSDLLLTEEEIKKLQLISNSRICSAREVERAKILLSFHDKTPIIKIARDLKVGRDTVYKCIDKALTMGYEHGLKDLPHSPKAPEITLEAKAWVISLACRKPKDLGFAAEIWSRQSLATYVRNNAESSGHNCLKKAAKATIHRILKEHKLQPHKIKYYLEKRDPDFDRKMEEVVLIYKEVALWNKAANDEEPNIITVCVDEKPGVQAIANTAEDLPPVAGKYSQIARDHEYVRHGTASILAGIDLHNGHVFAQVHPRHRSCEFIALLKDIDAYYPAEKQIRIVLDNHSSHTSKETREFLATKPNRFIYVHTPKHGSWLNLAETLFGKMARTFLKYIRVTSWEDLKERILKGVAEINQHPIVHKWTKFDYQDQYMSGF